MATNGEAIYGTTASPFDKPAWGRYTAKPGRLFAHVFDWPSDSKLAIPNGGRKITAAHLLADPRTALRIERTTDGVTIQLPQQTPDPIASVIAVEYKE
jgi:alpha-L-fucosidase